MGAVMRVIHVTNTSTQNVIGVDTHVLTLAAAQKDRGFSPMVVTDRPGYLTEACGQHDIPAAIENGLNPAGRAQWSPPEKTMKSLIATFTSFDGDVIHCHTLPVAVPAFFAADRVRRPCVFTHHDVSHDLPLGTAEMMGLRFTIICVSRAGFEYLRKGGASEERLYYVPNGTKPAPAERPGQHKSHRPNLMMVGVIEHRKGLDIAILGMHELRRRRGPACPVLNIYGTGNESEEKYFKEMTGILDLDDIVRFHGARVGILEHCTTTDVLIVPSRAEAVPVVVLEAMSRGMPIVASDVGEVAEMLPDPRYGRVIPVESIAAFADAVESLLSDIANGRFDPELLIARHQSFYTADKMAERIEPIYEKAVQRHTSLRLPEPGPRYPF
jgi:glycosyltransferase involved in cell wall biosynthesis